MDLKLRFFISCVDLLHMIYADLCIFVQIIGYAADPLYPLRKIVYFANVFNISQKNQQQKD